MKVSTHMLAVAAMFILSISYGCAGYTARVLQQELSTWQQLALQSWCGFLLGLLVIGVTGARVDLNKITSGHVAAVLLRGLIGRMLGSFFFIAACVHAPLGNVAWIAALPMSVVFDTLVFRQKVTVSQVVFLVIGFLGVGFIVTPSAGDARLIGWGELYAFLSVSCIGFSSVAIKKSTREIPVALSATAIIFVTAVASTAIAFFVDGGLVLPSTEYLPMLGLVTLMVTGGAMLSLYGYSQLSAATATSIITLEAIWALMLGALVYGELPGVLEIVGGGLIGFSALLIALMPPAEISHRKCGA